MPSMRGAIRLRSYSIETCLGKINKKTAIFDSKFELTKTKKNGIIIKLSDEDMQNTEKKFEKISKST